ncbi:hypothetical protein BH23CHL5_BH23CHL5_17000 [soil metagenome]
MIVTNFETGFSREARISIILNTCGRPGGINETLAVTTEEVRNGRTHDRTQLYSGS